MDEIEAFKFLIEMAERRHGKDTVTDEESREAVACIIGADYIRAASGCVLRDESVVNLYPEEVKKLDKLMEEYGLL